jgi:hypothetical protein
MKEALTIQINSVGDFIDKVNSLDYPKYLIFRGENQEFETPLTPKIARLSKFYKESSEFAIKLELQFLNWFKTESPQFLTQKLNSDIEYLILGQHHGLATRLLDFTLNPLVALYFAVEDECKKEDGFVYVVDDMLWDISENDLLFSSLDKIIDNLESDYHFFVPVNSMKRISSQSGVLAIAKDASKSVTNLRVIYKIKGTDKPKIKSMLYKINIHKGSLFQDLDSLCESLQYRRYNYNM